MNTSIFSNTILVVLTVLLIFSACNDNPGTSIDSEFLDEQDQTNKTLASQNEPQVVKVTARHEGDEYIFELSKNEIPSGWTTFRLINDSHSTHFAYLAQVPGGAITGAQDDGAELLDYWVQNITNPFQFMWDGILPDKEPNEDDAPEKYEDDFFPGWFLEVIPSGGPGLTAGMSSSETTVYLEKGEYIIECYVKNAENDFHSYLGMIELLTVTNENSYNEEPVATTELTISTNGIEFDRHISAGEHVVKVHFEDQTFYDHDLGHDIHLIRMDPGTSVAEVGEWMSWANPDGLISSSSANLLGPATFMGGAQTMTAGSTAYFHVDLEPGRYAWVSEIPDPHKNQMLKVFNVPRGQAAGR